MSDKLKEFLLDPVGRQTFEEEFLIGEVSDTIGGLLESLHLTQRELAIRLGVTEGRVSQILGRAGNIRLRTLATIGWALGIRFDLRPVAMADRRGTPAVSDAPAPAWLRLLGTEPARISRAPLELPKPATPQPGGYQLRLGERGLLERAEAA